MSEKQKLMKSERLAFLAAAAMILLPLSINPAANFIKAYWCGGRQDRQDYIAGATLVVLLAQAGIFYRQAKISGRQAAIAFEQSGIATKQVAHNAAIARAYVNVRIPQSGIKTSVPANGTKNVCSIEASTLVLSVENIGQTPAVITRIAWAVQIAARGEKPTDEAIVPPIDPRKVGGRPFPPGVEAAPGFPFTETENMFSRLFNDDAIFRLEAGENALWVNGFVRYRDVFDGNHIVGFCFVLDHVCDRFVVRGDSRYNYKRQEGESDIPPRSPPGAY